MKNKYIISIIGLGYVGLPLAVSFSKKYQVTGYDTDNFRIKTLNKNIDLNNDLNKSELIKVKQNIKYTNNILDIKNSNIFIVTVPTPINKKNKPDLRHVINASKAISYYLKPKDIVIYESTVYPGVTENICIPILEKNSSLIINKDFYCGYSPERINPGDKINKIDNIVKITSGSNIKASIIVDNLYKTIIKAGTYKASSIKVAEAAKAIENTQRDINIALMNELSIIFNKIGINTTEVIEAASSKWNFVKYLPGLVGGHCIGIDPYYLTHLATQNNIQSKIISSGRKLNNYMSQYIYDQCIKFIDKKYKKLKKINILFMGISYKENTPDVRNSKVLDIINLFNSSKYNVDIYDPIANNPKNNYLKKYLNFVNITENKYHLIILSTPHNSIKKLGIKKISSLGKKNFIFFDLKSVFSKKYSDFTL